VVEILMPECQSDQLQMNSRRSEQAVFGNQDILLQDFEFHGHIERIVPHARDATAVTGHCQRLENELTATCILVNDLT